MENIILPIVTLLIGWFLGEGSQVLRKRNDKVQSLNRVLADLLEIRHRLQGTQYVFSQLSSKFHFPAEVILPIRAQLPEPLNINPELKERFNRSIDILSSHDPLMAFFLRSKDILGETDRLFGEQVAQEPHSAVFIGEFRELIDKYNFPALDEAIMITSKKISYTRKNKIKAYLKDTEMPDPRIIEAVEQIATILNKHFPELYSEQISN